jgi:AAA domain, putative AbiEii toxin, Type IV TA system
VGDGILSLFFIVDSLYDAQPGEFIAIDEPELSLHPSLQRRLLDLFHEYSTKIQIVYATHSPFFLDIPALGLGAKLIRVFDDAGRSRCATLSTDSITALQPLLGDQNNPHVFGLNAREAFFLDERVILVEGQEDVVGYQSVQRQIGAELPASFFGWGVGGASKMNVIAGILHDLGFRRVVGLLDSNQEGVCSALTNQFPNYLFRMISAPDVRSKAATPARPARPGLLDENGTVRPEYRATTQRLLEEVRTFLG